MQSRGDGKRRRPGSVCQVALSCVASALYFAFSSFASVTTASNSAFVGAEPAAAAPNPGGYIEVVPVMLASMRFIVKYKLDKLD